MAGIPIDRLEGDLKKQVLKQEKPPKEERPKKAVEPDEFRTPPASKVTLQDLGQYGSHRRFLLVGVQELKNDPKWTEDVIQRCCDLAGIPNNGGRIGWENGQYIVSLLVDKQEGRPQ